MDVEKDGRLINTMEPPPLPTPQQSERIKKYGEDIVRKKEEQDRKAAQNEFLRHSIRNSQKMRALKHHAVQLGKYINTVRMPRALCNFLKHRFETMYKENAGQNEFHRHSIRNSEKMRALKHHALT